MPLYQLGDRQPQLADSVWLADSAHIIGDVRLAADVSIWFNAVLRVTTNPSFWARAATCKMAACCIPTRAPL